MTSVVFFGTLLHAPLFEVVAGRSLDGRPVHLPGETVMEAADGAYPVLVPGAGVDGLLVELDDAALARIDFYEACFEYVRHSVDVFVDGEPVTTQVWRPKGASTAGTSAWDISGWSATWGAISVEAAREVMRQFGSTPPEEVGARFWMIRSRAQSYLSARNWRRAGLVGSGFGLEAVDVQEHRFPYTKFFAAEEMRARFRRFDGGWSAPVERAMWRTSDAVTVLPYDPRRDAILLVEQARFGVLAHGDAFPWLLEPIAGMIDAGETAEQAGRREAMEEAGLDLGALHFVAKYYPSPGGIAQVLTSYVGIADLPETAQSIGGSLAEDEDIQSHVVPYDKAVALYEGGDLADAASVVSFQWLMLNRDRLRAAG